MGGASGRGAKGEIESVSGRTRPAASHWNTGTGKFLTTDNSDNTDGGLFSQDLSVGGRIRKFSYRCAFASLAGDSFPLPPFASSCLRVRHSLRHFPASLVPLSVPFVKSVVNRLLNCRFMHTDPNGANLSQLWDAISEWREHPARVP